MLIASNTKEEYFIRLERQKIEQKEQLNFTGGITNSTGSMEAEIKEWIEYTEKIFIVIKNQFLHKKEAAKKVKAEIVVIPTLKFNLSNIITCQLFFFTYLYRQGTATEISKNQAHNKSLDNSIPENPQVFDTARNQYT